MIDIQIKTDIRFKALARYLRQKTKRVIGENKGRLKVLAALSACAVIALPAFAIAKHKGDHLYDRYVAQQGAIANPCAYAVFVGSKEQYLSRSDMFIYVINDELNDGKSLSRHSGVVANSAVQNDWLAYCQSKNGDGARLPADGDLVAYAQKCGTPVLFLYPTDDVIFSTREKIDDGRKKMKFYADQHFVAVLADGNRVIDRMALTVRGDSSHNRDRALIDAFEEGVERAEAMLYRLK